jgi:DNA-binding Xre family transcriptional regulator
MTKKKTSKTTSELDRFISNPKRKKLFDNAYKELTISEILVQLMEEQALSVRLLAKEVGVSPTVIQGLRTKKHSNLKLSTLFELTAALGATIKIEIGDQLVTLKE